MPDGLSPKEVSLVEKKRTKAKPEELNLRSVEKWAVALYRIDGCARSPHVPEPRRRARAWYG